MATLNAYNIATDNSPIESFDEWNQANQLLNQVTNYGTITYQSSIQLWGQVEYKGETILVKYNGSFNYSTEEKFLNSTVNGYSLSINNNLVGDFYSSTGYTVSESVQANLSIHNFNEYQSKLFKNNDTLNGGDADDDLWGYTGIDTLNGGFGDDILNGGVGNDNINGGNGSDTAVFSDLDNQIDLLITNSQNTGDGNDTLTSIENINAGGGDDTVNGNSEANTLNGENGNDEIYGNYGNDKLIGELGNDKLVGGVGNDNLIGGEGNDILFGGSGKDTAVFSSNSNTVNLSIIGEQNTNDGVDIINGVENIISGKGNDKLYGSIKSNILDGGSGNDLLVAGKGNDLLVAGAGEDELIGGKGKDELIGGKGKDIFKLSKGKGYDLIQDFKNKQDKIFVGSMKKLKLKNKGKDVYIFKGKDLLAKVKGAKGDLSKKDKFFV